MDFQGDRHSTRPPASSAGEDAGEHKPSMRLRLAAQGLGTFLFLFVGFNAIAVARDFGTGAISTLGVAVAFGLGLAMAIAALGHISGGHFNPVVSLGVAVGRKFPPGEVIP
jgi:aquaporin Z